MRVEPPPAYIFGHAFADGQPVRKGTVIVATSGDQKVGSAIVMEDGKFGPLEMMQPTGGKRTVNFKVGGRMSKHQYYWNSGGREVIMLEDYLLSPV